MVDNEEFADGARVPLIPSSSHRSSKWKQVSQPDDEEPTADLTALTALTALTDSQIGHALDDFVEANRSILDKTKSRILVENVLSKFRWYNPNRDDPNAPSLTKGWAYFEHFTLPRRYKEKIGGHHVRAPPGAEAKDTELYGPFSTPKESFSDWGIGMGMYFASLQTTLIIFVLSGCVNIANSIYYAGDQYDPGDGLKILNLPQMLQFSAICTDREWVVCSEPEGAETCRDNSHSWDKVFSSKYYGTAKDADTGETVTLINRTTCLPAQFAQGMINYGSLILLIVCMALYMWYMNKKEVRFDEDSTTPSDYSILIHNPPPDALDPDEWRDFFNKFSDDSVTLCTVALDNERLVAKLVQRRKEIKDLKHRLLAGGAGVDFDDKLAVDAAVEDARRRREAEEAERGCLSKSLSCVLAPLLGCLGFAATETTIWEQIKVTTEEVREIQKREYKAAAVYVTFETEQAQRTVLKELDASEIAIMTNRGKTPDAMFQGRVLRVEEAGEPSAVRWADLQFGMLSVYLRQAIVMGITIGLVALSGLILHLARTRVSTIVFSVILSTFNSIIPKVVNLLISYEKHYDEGSLQRSLYLNITVFRWMNTAIMTRMITPLVATLGDDPIDLINTVNALMISEMLVSPLLRYFDFSSIIKRHYLAPRAKTEEELFGYFNGGWYNLAERYTDFTKVLLLCTFYSAFYPLIYFMGAGILFFQYWTDKYLLLRSWQKAPMIGPETAQFSRTYFNTLAILLGAISSGYAYFKSPFTMLCSCAENNKECTLPGTLEFTNVMLKNDTTVPSVLASDEGFYFCNQDINPFPPLPWHQGSNKWMTGSQEHLVHVYGWTCLALLILYCVCIFGHSTVSAVVSLLKGVYEPSGYDQKKDFSSGIGRESFGYIPQLAEVPGFHFPLLVCNIDDVDVGLIGWKDPNSRIEVDPHQNYDSHNLIFDVPHETLHRSRNEAEGEGGEPKGKGKGRPIFSIVKHYPPKWALQTRDDDRC